MTTIHLAEHLCENGDWKASYIVYVLASNGTTVRKLSIANEYKAGSLKTALRRSWPAAEEIIASKCGVAAKEIWPSRYSSDGTPKRAKRKKTTA